MQRCILALRKGWRELRQDERGMQTMEWILLLGLIGTVLLGLIGWFGSHQTQVGDTIWNLITHWLDKMKI